MEEKVPLLTSSLVPHPSSLRVRAPAKLNLFLRVVGRRTDGFHELETVFQSIDLADELTFALGDELRLTGGSDAAPPGPENLVLRAAEALRRTTGYVGGASIHLEKQIPVGAGLGGGSSDAAATLLALNRLWNLGLGMDRLTELAAKLGSDVPFALQGGTALGRGRGEILEALPTPPFWFVLLRPPFSVATAGAYSLYRPAGRKAPAVEAFLAALAEGDPRSVALLLRNDLESGVFGAWPVLSGLRKLLLGTTALGARMTGSGSVVFGLAWDEDHARQIAAQLEHMELGLWVRVARALPAEA